MKAGQQVNDASFNKGHKQTSYSSIRHSGGTCMSVGDCVLLTDRLTADLCSDLLLPGQRSTNRGAFHRVVIIIGSGVGKGRRRLLQRF